MSTTGKTVAPSNSVNTSAFWERLWRTSGFQFVALSIIAYLIYDNADRWRIIALVVFGLAVLYLMWFAAAIRVTLAEAGQDGWGSAATAASAAVGALFLLLVAAGVAGLSNLAWACFVLSSFVRAMLTMAPTFGFWRAGIISNSLFAVGVLIVVLTVLGGTTWLSVGPWAPDGVYSRFVSPAIGLAWVVVLNVVLWSRPAARSGW